MAKEAVTKPPDPEWTDGLKKFSTEIDARFPGAIVKRYVLPLGVRDAPGSFLREVFMRELTTSDTIEAAIMADGLMSGPEKSSVRLSRAAEEREQIRIAVVGLGRSPAKDDAVMYQHINDTPVPFSEMNRWGKRITDALSTYFNDVNGMPLEEFIEGLKGAQIIGAFASPTSATRASASPGPLGG